MTKHSLSYCAMLEQTADDIKILKSRKIASDSENYPIQALHVYRLNADVDQ